MYAAAVRLIRSDLDGGETPSDAIILRTQLSRVESVLSNERSLQKAGKLR